MADIKRASDAPPSAPSFATVAVATGAAVLAGLVLGRRGFTGIAAGVAAAAGANWLKGRRDEITRHGAVSTKIDLAPEVQPPQSHGVDWVDHDAVQFGHVVPDAGEAAAMLEESTLPLLDDEGLPVDKVTVHPVYPETLIHESPLGPIIWEPGRFVQSSSDGAGETVWFGLQDMMPQLHAPKPHVPALPAGTSMDIIASHVEKLPAAVVTAVPTTIPADPAFVFVAPPVQAPAAPSCSPFLGGPVNCPHEAAPNASLANMGMPAAYGSPSSSAAAITPSIAAAGQALVITSKQTTGSILPQPRRAGELPGRTTAHIPASCQPAQASVPPHDRHGPSTEFVSAWSVSPSAAHRHLTPIAPINHRKRRRRWPWVSLLILLIAIAFFFAANRWQDGALVRNVKALPWIQEHFGLEHAAALPSSPLDSPRTDPSIRGPWRNAVSEPVK